MNRHIVTLYYEPTEKAKELYGRLKERDDTELVLLNAGSMSESKDPWVKANVTFESEFSDNLSRRNSSFCELTSIYAAWRNLSPDWKDTDTVQHSHYRKTLDESDCTACDDGTPTLRVAHPYPMKFQTERGFIQNCTIETGTMICHPRASWKALETVVGELGSWRDNSDFEIWRNLPYMPAPINIWSMPVIKFKEYCEWLFPRVMEIDRMIPYDAVEYRTAYQRRALSFLGERLFSFWAWSRDRRGEIRTIPTRWTLHDFKPISDSLERLTRI